MLPGNTTVLPPGLVSHTVPGVAPGGPCDFVTIGIKPTALIADSAWAACSSVTTGTLTPPPDTFSTIVEVGDSVVPAGGVVLTTLPAPTVLATALAF